MSVQWDSNSKDDRSSNYDYTSFLLKFQWLQVQQSHRLVCLCARDFVFTWVTGFITHSGESEHWINPVKDFGRDAQCCYRICYQTERKTSLAGVESWPPVANTRTVVY